MIAQNKAPTGNQQFCYSSAGDYIHCMKGEKSYSSGVLRIQPLCFNRGLFENSVCCSRYVCCCFFSAFYFRSSYLHFRDTHDIGSLFKYIFGNGIPANTLGRKDALVLNLKRKCRSYYRFCTEIPRN